MTVRVHNDDVHTFEYVITTFSQLGIGYSEVMCMAILCGGLIFFLQYVVRDAA